MKSHAIPFEQVAAPAALLSAWRHYRSGKRLRPEVAVVEMDHERVVLELSGELLAGRYVHRPYRVLRITDPKPRLIAVATVRDRLVHTAMHRALAPLFDRSFIDDSYACLPGRGSHRAVLRFLELFRRHNQVMHLDVRRYFPSVDHGLLRELVVPRLRDRRWHRLIDAILASGRALYGRPEVREFYGGQASYARPCGLPIGNLTSQWWGNLFLDGLDHFVKRTLRVGGYLRYMDDMVLFADEPGVLRAWRADIQRWMANERRLELNPSKGHVHPTSVAHTYLGYRVTRAGYDLAPTAARRFRGSLPALMREDPRRIQRTLASWRGAMSF